MSQSKSLVFLAAAFMLIGLPLSANAEFAQTTQNVNLRTGPGTEYDKLATLAAGIRVDILKCQPNWCRIAGQGIRGWVSSGYLDRAIVIKPIVVVRPIVIVRPHIGHRPHHRKCKIAPGFSCK